MELIMFTSFLFSTLVVINVLRGIYRKRQLVEERLKKYTYTLAHKAREEEDILNKPFTQRVIKPALSWFSGLVNRFTPAKSRDKLEQALVNAGRPGNLTAQEFQAIYMLSIGATSVGVFILLALFGKTLVEQLLLALLAGIVMSLGGKSFLNSRARQRKAEIQKELPNAVDLLCVSVEAGLGFDSALQQVAAKSKGALATEFLTTLRELQMGKSRRDALRDLGTRTDVDDMLNFVGAMIQADQLGVSITKILRIQAEQVRMRRRQRVEEKAMKAPIKMLIPMVLFIFPTIFIILLAPAAIKVYEIMVGKVL